MRSCDSFRELTVILKDVLARLDFSPEQAVKSPFEWRILKKKLFGEDMIRVSPHTLDGYSSTVLDLSKVPSLWLYL